MHAHVLHTWMSDRVCPSGWIKWFHLVASILSKNGMDKMGGVLVDKMLCRDGDPKPMTDYCSRCLTSIKMDRLASTRLCWHAQINVFVMQNYYTF